MSKNTKLPKFLEAMKIVLSDINSVTLTDREVWVDACHLMREKGLKPPSYRSFEYWKSPTQGGKKTQMLEENNPELMDDFRFTLEYSRVRMKKSLTKNMLVGGASAYGSNVILSKKFEDMRDKQNNISIGSGTEGITITVGEQSHVNLIDNILNGTEIIDIDHQEIENNPKQLDE